MVIVKSLSYDICALAILILLFCASFSKRLYRAKVNHTYVALLAVALFTTAADIWSIHFDNIASANLSMREFSHFLYLVSHSLTPPLFVNYVIVSSDTWHIFKKNLSMLVLLVAPVSIVIGALLCNAFLHNVFYFDAAYTYCRGSLFLILYLSAAFYLVLGLYYLARCRRLFPMDRFIAMFVVFPLVGISTVIQMFVPSLTIEMLAIALCLLYLSLIVTRSEEVMDADTGLQARTAYVRHLKNAQRTEKQETILMLNIANYDSVRQMLGYEVCTNLMKMIAKQLIELDDELNLNGELFHLNTRKFRIITDAPADRIQQAAEKLNSDLKENLILNGLAVNLIACVCIAHIPTDISDAESLIAFENELGSKYYTGEVLYAADLYQRSRYEIMKDIDRTIEHALTHNEFEVYYQPIYSVVEQRFTTAEALCRLRTADGRFISPDIFIPAAEHNGTIHKIGSFVLNEVCAFIVSDEFKKLNLRYIEVNLSVMQCMQKELADDILQTLKKYGVSPSQINLEITETAASYSQTTLIQNLYRLSEAGIRLSLDDFGSGYSNMMRIASLPLHIVKLDKTLADLAQKEEGNVVLKSTIQMLKELQKEIVVEGVESADLASKFASWNCEFIQGFYYSRPLPRQELITFLTNL